MRSSPPDGRPRAVSARVGRIGSGAARCGVAWRAGAHKRERKGRAGFLVARFFRVVSAGVAAPLPPQPLHEYFSDALGMFSERMGGMEGQEGGAARAVGGESERALLGEGTSTQAVASSSAAAASLPRGAGIAGGRGGRYVWGRDGLHQQLRARLAGLNALRRQTSEQDLLGATKRWVAGRRAAGARSFREADARLRALRFRLRRYEEEITEWSDSLAPYGDTKLRLFVQRTLYTLAQAALMATCFALGRDIVNAVPIFFAFLLFLLPVKCYYYYQVGYQFFLGDFCYFVNALCGYTLAPAMVGARVSAPLLAMAYVTSTGPVAWATLAWQCELVPHHYDKLTSVLVHVLPALVVHVARFHMPVARADAEVISVAASAPAEARAMGMRWLLAGPLMFYLGWQLSNFVLLQCACRRHLEANKQIETSYRTLVRRAAKGGGNCLHRFVVGPGHPPWWRVFAFGLLQGLYSVVTGSVGVALWHSEVASNAFLAAVVGAAVFNASRFQFVTVCARYFTSPPCAPAICARAANTVHSVRQVPRRFKRALQRLAEDSDRASEAADAAVRAADVGDAEADSAPERASGG